MNQHKINLLLFWLVREVAALHARNEALLSLVEELRVTHPETDKINTKEIHADAWQSFLSSVENVDPEMAALIDNRKPDDL